MAQGPLPFEYQSEESSTGLTSFAGLPVFLDLMFVMRFAAVVREHLRVRPTQGWSDTQHLVSLICLHLAGGDCVEDLHQLQADEGFCHLLEQVEGHGLRARQRRALKKRWRRTKVRSVPSPDASLRFLEEFDDPEESRKVQPGTAYVPKPNKHLAGLFDVLASTCAFAQLHNPQTVATLDQDATLIETSKEAALYCYKKFKAYQPLNVFWHEQGLMLYSEFRDGNCPAAWRNLDVLQAATSRLPLGVRQVRVRMDTAGYDRELLTYLAEGRDQRFGVIDFAIGVDVMPEFKAAASVVHEEDWQVVYLEDKDGNRWKTEQEVAEVCYVPNWVGHKKGGPIYRFVAIRQPIENELPGMESEQPALPFPVWSSTTGQRYKLFGVVTNIDAETMDGDALIRWHRQRCGDSEQVHSVLKSDLGAGQLPSSTFGANAAWWSIALMACNLHVLMQRLVFGREGLGQRLKAVRFGWLAVAGRVITHARKTIIRLSADHRALAIIEGARARLLTMATGPPLPRPASV
jgi:uncharacterized protein (DUF1684 family)